MGLKIMPKAALPQWVDHLRAQYRVVGPQKRHEQYVFGDIQNAAQLELDYPTSVLPPKKYLLPPREELFRFQKGGARIEVPLDAQPTVILGLHTCDLHAVQLLDHVNTNGWADQHYLTRREATLLVSIECLKPCMEHSFCKSMGTLTATEGFDLHLTDLGDDYAVDVGTEAGEAILRAAPGLREPMPDDYRKINQVMSEKWPRFPLRLDFDVTELPNLLSVSQQNSLWQELGDRCLACGMCTQVCPTCYCFDVNDEADLTLQNGVRVRTWDSCQIERFALVAGGHNFRASRALRQRHRFLRKGKYQTEAFGLMGCVGCGRCAAACLVHITPVDTFNELYRRLNQGDPVEVHP